MRGERKGATDGESERREELRGADDRKV